MNVWYFRDLLVFLLYSDHNDVGCLGIVFDQLSFLVLYLLPCV